MIPCITYDGRVIFMLMNVNAGMPAGEGSQIIMLNVTIQTHNRSLY